MRGRCTSYEGHISGYKGLFMVLRPRRRVDVVVSVYSSASGFSDRTNHSPRGCVASTEGYNSSRRTSDPCGGQKEDPQGRKGSVTPLRCVNAGP